MKIHHLPLLLLALIPIATAHAQNSPQKKQASTRQKNPESFTFSASLFNKLVNLPVKSVISEPSNKYLHKSTLLLNTKTGDMQLIKVKLAYFSKAYLMIQFSGTNSTQIFIVSDNKSVFYKGKQDKDVIIMTKCKEDDIVTE